MLPFYALGFLDQFQETNATLGLASRLPFFAAGSVWCGLAWWLGSGVVRLGLGTTHWALSIPLSLIAGFAWLSSLVMLIGWLVGTNSQVAMLALVASVTAVGFFVRSKSAGEDPSPRSPAIQTALEPDSVPSLWLIRLMRPLVGLLVLFYLLVSLTPAWEFDVVEYHLQGPKEFYQLGRIQFLPHNVYANMPLGGEMHALAAMMVVGGEDAWWWGGLFGKLIIAIHAILSALLVAGFVHRKFGSVAGLASGGLLLATAGTIHVSLNGLVDIVTGTYLLAMIVVLAKSLEAPCANNRFYQTLLLATFAGGTAACKYPGYIFAVVPLIGWLVIQPWVARWFGQSANEAQWKTSWLPIISACTLGLCLTCLPWLLKNAMETQNPFYPLASSVFPVKELSETQLNNWNRVHSPQPENGSAFSFATLSKSTQQLLWTSPYLNPSLIFLGLLGLIEAWLRRDRSALLFLGFIIWILATWWFLTHRIDRFWFPALPLFAILSGYGLARLAAIMPTFVPASISLGGILFGTLQAFSGVAITDTRAFIALDVLRKEWTSLETDEEILKPVAFVNERIDASNHILSIGEAQAFHFQPDLVYATCFNTNQAEEWLRGLPAEVQKQNLIDQGITHVLVNWADINRYRSPGNYGFSDWPQSRDLDRMVDGGVLEELATPFNPAAWSLYEVAR